MFPRMLLIKQLSHGNEAYSRSTNLMLIDVVCVYMQCWNERELKS